MTRAESDAMANLAKKITLYGVALLTMAAIAGGVNGYFARQTARQVRDVVEPIVAEERAQRQQIISRIDLLDSRVSSMGEALKHPLFSDAREEALETTTAPPPRRRAPVRR